MELSCYEMFLFGASMFTYTGKISPIISNIGMYSFLFWLPTVFMGVILIAIPFGRRKIIDKTNEDKAKI